MAIPYLPNQAKERLVNASLHSLTSHQEEYVTLSLHMGMCHPRLSYLWGMCYARVAQLGGGGCITLRGLRYPKV